MKKILSILVATALTGITVFPARADNPSIKNGMPCVAEVCAGDYLKNLGNIQWISVDKKRLAKVLNTKFCEVQRLDLSYISKTAKKVDVKVELYPLNDGKSQEFVVTSIATTLPNTSRLSADQFNQIRTDVARKYGSLNISRIYRGTGDPGSQVSMSLNMYGNQQIFLEFSNGLNFADTDKLFSKYPGCAKPKINID